MFKTSFGKGPSALNDFRTYVEDLGVDVEILKHAQGLLQDIAQINSLKFKMEQLENALMTPERAPFYLHAMRLTEEELVAAAENVRGRVTFLQNKADREKEAAAAASAAESATDSLTDSEVTVSSHRCGDGSCDGGCTDCTDCSCDRG